jgi:hypothetical protein
MALPAAVQSLTAEDDAAMQSLLLSQDNYNLSWAELSSFAFVSLQSRQDFQALVKHVQVHLNKERARLGWGPVKI